MRTNKKYELHMYSSCKSCGKGVYSLATITQVLNSTTDIVKFYPIRYCLKFINKNGETELEMYKEQSLSFIDIIEDCKPILTVKRVIPIVLVQIIAIDTRNDSDWFLLNMRV